MGPFSSARGEIIISNAGIVADADVEMMGMQVSLHGSITSSGMNIRGYAGFDWGIVSAFVQVDVGFNWITGDVSASMQFNAGFDIGIVSGGISGRFELQAGLSGVSFLGEASAWGKVFFTPKINIGHIRFGTDGFTFSILGIGIDVDW